MRVLGIIYLLSTILHCGIVSSVLPVAVICHSLRFKYSINLRLLQGMGQHLDQLVHDSVADVLGGSLLGTYTASM